MVLRRIILLVNFLLYISIISAQSLVCPIYNYSSKNYGQNHSSTNWCVVQDKLGILYFGNANGILTLDSKNWDFISVKPSKWVVSLAVDGKGIIYVGSQTEFGYLIKENTGNLIYYSLSDSLPPGSLDFGNIWKINAVNDDVFFHSEEKIFKLTNNQLSEYFPETTFHLSFSACNRYFVRVPEVGLMKFENNNFKLISDGDIFAETGIIEILDKTQNICLILTKKEGIFEYDTEKNILTKVVEKYPDLILNAELYGAINLNNGNIAINTINQGIIIINTEGEVVNIINENNGLKYNKVYSIIADNQNNIWATLENGISKIDYTSPFLYYNEQNGLNGNIRKVLRFNNELFVASTSGLFSILTENKFNYVNDFTKEIWDLLVVDNELLIGTVDNLFSYNGKFVNEVAELNSFTLYYSENFKTLFVGGNDGLFAFRKYGINWILVKNFDELQSIDIKSIAENKIKSDKNQIELWLGTAFHGVLRVNIENDFENDYDFYGEEDEISDEWTLTYNFDSTVLFSCKDGLLHFIDEEVMKKILPDSLKDKPEFYRGFFEPHILNNDTIGKNVVYTFASGKDIWLSIDNEPVVYYNKKNKKTSDFLEIDMGRINNFFIDSSLCWISAEDGLICYNYNKSRKLNSPFYTILKSISINTDSVIALNYIYSDSLSYLNSNLYNPEIEYKYNSLKFEFISPFYNSSDKTLYSYYLEGFSSDWSDWDLSNSKDFTNLSDGEYIFKVKSKNIFNIESVVNSFAFTILAPWYRTNIAYFSYFVLFVLLIIIIVKISILRLKNQNKKLELIVEQRTFEIKAKNQELATQKDLIQKKNDDIISSISYASKIQQALFPSEDTLKNNAKDYFILNKPRDIVSGDFFWVLKKDNKMIFTVADCTGHGVPGAFMSLLGIAFLNEIVNEINDIKPDIINNLLRNKVITSLHQSANSVTKDGMDIALCVVDFDSRMLSFSGAYNPMYLVRDNQLTEINADRMPIGFHFNKLPPFTVQSIEYNENDIIYLFSDGYADQFGGDEGKKFKYNQLKELFLRIHKLSFIEQRVQLDLTFEKWVKDKDLNTVLYPQIDDILIMGVKL